MKPSPWNVNLANIEKRHNGLTDVTAKEVLIRFWANEQWEISLPHEAWSINKNELSCHWSPNSALAFC